MPTFRSKEIVDARQFVGGGQNGSDVVFWVNSNEGLAFWSPGYDPSIGKSVEYIHLTSKFDVLVVHEGDWIVRKQNGVFVSERPGDFERKYEQV